MKLFKDYDCTILYHPGKGNVVADALSRKSMGSLAHIVEVRRPLVRELHNLEASDMCFGLGDMDVFLAHVQLRSTLVEEIKVAQPRASSLAKLMDVACKGKVSEGKAKESMVDFEGVLRCGVCLCVPDVDGLRQRVLREAHHSIYTIHPGTNKMYRDIKTLYWWNKLKEYVAKFVSRYAMCQQVKVEHQKSSGEIQKISIPEWKWERLTVDFVVGLPTSKKGSNSIWVIIDRLTKSTVFILVNTSYTVPQYVQKYLDYVVRLHGVPLSIISD